MKNRAGPFVENIMESGVACLLAMVQGNVLALTTTHWVIASRTGLLAGVAASVALVLLRSRNAWIVSFGLGIATAIADFFVHPGGFGPVALEAIVTGSVAALLALFVVTLRGSLRRSSSAVSAEASGSDTSTAR